MNKLCFNVNVHLSILPNFSLFLRKMVLFQTKHVQLEVEGISTISLIVIDA